MFANNLKTLREAANMSQKKVAESVHISTNAYQRYEYGERDIPGKVLIRLADLFSTSTDKILGTEFIMPSSSDSDFVEVPVLGVIAAGTPIDMMEMDDTHPCPTLIRNNHPNSGWLKVEGDSYNEKLPNGCYALVDFDLKEPKENTPFAVCVNGYNATIKDIKKLANGFELIPRSYDPTYLPIIYDYNKEDTEEITIIGQVVYASFPFDWEF